MRQVFLLPNAIRQSDGAWTKEVELEDMTGVEQDILTDRRTDPKRKGKPLRSFQQRFTDILSRCTVRVGRETRAEGKTRWDTPDHFAQVWKDAFLADRAFITVRLRQLSFGDAWTFKATCPHCGNEGTFTADLNELGVTDVPLEQASMTMHEVELEGGRKIQWRFLTGNDAGLLDDILRSRKEDVMSATIFAKILSLNGEKMRFEDLRRMSARDRSAILSDFEGREGGLNANVTNTCEEEDCQKDFDIAVDASRLDFFLPLTTTSGSRMKSSA